MSHVTNVMLSVSPSDRANAAALSTWLENRAPRRDGQVGSGSLRLQTGEDTLWGGWKHPECEVWAGTLNHADLDAVREQFRLTQWEYPAEVQLFLLDQDDDFLFSVWILRDGELQLCRPVEY